MPYKIVHIADNARPIQGIEDYEHLNDLFINEGWEMDGEPVQVTHRGVKCERYRLRKGPAETGVTTRSPRDVAAQGDGPGGGVMADGGISLSTPGAAGQLAQLLAGQASHLGVSQAHNIPGAHVVSGNSHMMLGGAGADAAAAGHGEDACPFAPGSLEAERWIAGYRAQRSKMGEG